MVADETPWDRGDVRAFRRVLAVVNDVEVEILVDIESVTAGVTILGSPGLYNLDNLVVNGRWIDVLSLPTMLAILDAMGQSERAAMVQGVLPKIQQGTE